MELPAWLTPLPDAAQQRALDAWAIGQHRIPAETLMERAGSALARVCADLVPEGPIVIAVVAETTAATATSRRGCCVSSGAR